MQTKPYGFWESPLAPANLFQRPSSPMLPAYHAGAIYWLQARAAEGGRIVLMRKTLDGAECVTPEGFNIRTQVHEYGGACHCFIGEHVYFVNYADQRVYRQVLAVNAAPEPLTSAPGEHKNMFAALTPVPNSPWLICIHEREIEGAENENTIAALRSDAIEAQPVILVSGADFYASLAINDKGNRLAFMQWHHPNMPWDESVAMTSELLLASESIKALAPTPVSPKSNSAVCQVTFAGDEHLYFAMDGYKDGYKDYAGSNFWNIYRATKTGPEQITAEAAEFGSAHWVFGHKRLVPVAGGNLLAIKTNHKGDTVSRINPKQQSLEIVETSFTQFEQLSAATNGGKVLAVAASTTAEPCLVEINVDSLALTQLTRPHTACNKNEISQAQPISYPTRDGNEAHAYFYAPKNTAFKANHESKPPLLVLVHGGPTSRTDTKLNLLRQYWTGSGFALLDVNHRGSTGYGRTYRQALQGQWGVIDVDDIVDGVKYVTQQAWADENKVFIRGGSAGGYAVLRALTVYPQTFCGGACYYGIGNLQTLQELTHKFESRYTDGLVGEPYHANKASQAESVYQLRSPINHIENIACPVILFQGDRDKIVPPELSREMAQSLATRNVPYEYVEYAGEGHGFRKSETRVDSLEKEIGFYRSILEKTRS